MTELRMPAEWERHRSTWVSWPHNQDTWPGAFREAEAAYARMIQALAREEPVDINVSAASEDARIRSMVGETLHPVRLHAIPTNDAWCRDHGPTMVRATSRGLTAIDFEYNAWGGKYPPFDLDAKVAGRIAGLLGVERVDAGLILEGGAIEVNGDGVLLTTASCVLNENRNPGLTRRRAEEILGGLLGVTEIIWVEGELEGDDTDGHVDNLARFVGPKDIVMSVPGPSGGDESLEQGFRKLQRDGHALGLRVHPLPLPPRQYSPPASGQRVALPASYANFYITNGSVVVPGYDADADAVAADILQGFFPERRIEIVDCRPIVWGLGAVHCLTQQIPV